MITDEDIDMIGTMLEDKGMTHSDIDAYFLEHYGVKGMRWGVRNKDRSRQGRADKLQRVADRRPTRGNVRKAAVAQKRAKKPNFWARRSAKKQAKVEAGARRAQHLLQIAATEKKVLMYRGVRGSNIYQVESGKEFVDHLMRGGAIDPMRSGVYARLNKQGKYERVPGGG